MKAALLVCAVALAILCFLWYRGNRVLRRRDSFLEHIREVEQTELEYLDCIHYHGGLPEIPKPQKLNIAVSGAYLLLFSNAMRFGKVPFDRWHETEVFTTKRKQDPARLSIVTWGPWSQLVRKDIVRHFMVIHYIDSENQDNHLLLEHPDRERLKELHERLSTAWKSPPKSG